jgi:DNA processing protein
VAVLGTGADIVYPAKNHALAHELAARGALVSEYPLGTSPLPGNFPRRNRLISGLALGCLVVEAAADSGSLITARLAAEQGREVFAIPGSIHSPLARGCHALIKQGAKLVESANDILEELKLQAPPPPASAARGARTRPLRSRHARSTLRPHRRRNRRSPHATRARRLRRGAGGRAVSAPGALGFPPSPAKNLPGQLFVLIIWRSFAPPTDA